MTGTGSRMIEALHLVRIEATATSRGSSKAPAPVQALAPAGNGHQLTHSRSFAPGQHRQAPDKRHRQRLAPADDGRGLALGQCRQHRKRLATVTSKDTGTDWPRLPSAPPAPDRGHGTGWHRHQLTPGSAIDSSNSVRPSPIATALAQRNMFCITYLM